MLQVTHHVFRAAKKTFYGSQSVLLAARYSSCDDTNIKEAPLLENECVTALPEETKMRNNLETTIMVPTMADLTPINGIPEEYIRTRRVRIFQPVKNAMQSGTNNLNHWEMEFDNCLRWENPLMGWTSSADPLAGLRLRFINPVQAIEHCEKNGWMWYVDVPRSQREFRQKNFADNFSWNKRTRISTK